jgi:RNA polymerase sigma-70 factor (ECF subfamily)
MVRVAAEGELGQYRQALLTYAYRLTRDAHEAEDIVHSAMLKALQALRSGEAVANVRAWLYRITHNEAVSARRRAKLRRETCAQILPSEPAPPGREALLERVRAELDGLREPYASALRLRYLQHLKLEEVAEVLGLPLNTVKSHMARGLRLLTERLGDALEERRQ